MPGQNMSYSKSMCEHTLAVASCSCSALRRAVQLSMRAFRSATLSLYSASLVACGRVQQVNNPYHGQATAPSTQPWWSRLGT